MQEIFTLDCFYRELLQHMCCHNYGGPGKVTIQWLCKDNEYFRFIFTY